MATASSEDASAAIDRFFSRVDGFDVLARPTALTKYSSIGDAKQDTVEYHLDTAQWVIGQVKRQTSAGIEVSRAEFDGRSLPWKLYRNGNPAVEQTLGYHADGTLAAVTDARQYTTTLSNWKRGIPQHIGHPDQTAESAVVDDDGQIVSTTDENGASMTYGYDPMGRIARVTYPTGDTTDWNAETITFTHVHHVEHGLAPGHWTLSRRAGDRHVNTYYDAMWRPVVEEAFDSANTGGTYTWKSKRYDHGGRLVFESYPRNPYESGWTAWNAALAGVHTVFDVLGRPVQVQQDSELGPLVTRIEYLPGFRRRTVNPRNVSTVEQFQVFDVPDYSAPVVIDGGEGTRTTIYRDALGKPRSMMRGASN